VTCDIRNHSSMTGIEKVAKSLYEYAQENLGFNKPARVVFESQGDRATDIFSPTGNYNPQNKTITVFVDRRHPKDILRSMAHELVHHAQCCQGAFDGQIDTSPGYAQKDDRMRDLERDAYFWGNGILFRDWEDNYKSKRSWNLMNENKKMSLNEKKLRQKIRNMVLGILEEQQADVDADIKGSAAAQSVVASAARQAADIETDEKEADVESAMDEGKKHDCANHVKENLSGREGRCINHTLLEDGSVTHYTVEFQNEIVENIPVEHLTEIKGLTHEHEMQREDYDHDESKPRKPFEEGELKNPEKADLDDDGELSGYEKARGAAIEKEMNEEQQPLKEWYNDTLHEALMRKFKIKK